VTEGMTVISLSASLKHKDKWPWIVCATPH